METMEIMETMNTMNTMKNKKHVLIIPDGAADSPQASLGGLTPFQAASTPALDGLAARGRVGLTNHVPDSLPPGSEVACMSLVGYDPLVFFTGRAPIEAAAQGIVLGPADFAVRCNLVTIRDRVMEDFTAGHVSTAEATELLASAQAGLARDFPALAAAWRFVPGVSYRNLLLYRGEGTCGVQAAEDAAGGAPLGPDLRTIPPHDLMDKPIADSFPRGTGSRLLTEIMTRSVDWLANHPVNEARIAAGKRPATHVWLWGAGKAPAFEPFTTKYGLSGTMITGVDLLRGLAALAGWKRLEVPGAPAPKTLSPWGRLWGRLWVTLCSQGTEIGAGSTSYRRTLSLRTRPGARYWGQTQHQSGNTGFRGGRGGAGPPASRRSGRTSTGTPAHRSSP